ncbi:MAG: hypothetical protein ABFC96_15020 [Thermoguttaceae bacterium]
MRRWILCLAVLALALYPSMAYANAGTPLMWAGMLHLVFGNFFIGVGEGLLLALLFRRPKLACMGVMILANYFSAWVGMLFIEAVSQRLQADLDLYNTWQWIWRLVAVTYVFTLLLEWPFVALCFRKSERWFRKSVWASLIVQSASYLVLFGWYWSASGTTLYTEMAIVQPSQLSLPDGVTLYYIADSDGDVYAWSAGQPESKRISELGSCGQNDRLFAEESTKERGRWDLVARLQTADPKEADYKVLLRGLTATAATETIHRYRTDERAVATWGNLGDVPRLGAGAKSDWTFDTGFYSVEGLCGKNAKDGRRLRFSLETPFVQWSVRNAVQLPGDFVVFQLGNNQICILDPNTRRVALLAKGRGPVPMLLPKEQPTAAGGNFEAAANPKRFVHDRIAAVSRLTQAEKARLRSQLEKELPGDLDVATLSAIILLGDVGDIGAVRKLEELQRLSGGETPGKINTAILHAIDKIRARQQPSHQ